MVKKSEFVKRLLVEVKLRGSYPKRRKAGFSLLEEGVKAVLMRHLPEKKAESSVAALRDGFVDWNRSEDGTRLNSSHVVISYAGCRLKKKNKKYRT